ncbi:hypothetical protein GD1_41 [Paraglaciecola Antarctic GD virus 1]|nr:hypothetical protein GD1_41 [Paraglaciecola Antarctic GD virus 1]
MKSFTSYIEESVSTNDLPKGVLIGQSSGQAGRYNGYTGAIATIRQKTSKKSDRSLFPVSDFDMKEFGSLIKAGETMCRISTPMTSNVNTYHRSICFVNVKTAKIKFVDDDKYVEGELKADRPLKFDYLNIDPDQLKYFGITE